VLLWRGLAGVLAVATLWPAGAAILWALLVFLIAAHGPDASGEGQSDPCCDDADTWGDVAWGVGWGLVLAAVSIAMLYGGLILAGFALKGYWPKLLGLRRLFASFGSVVAAIAAYWAVLLVLY
jgi:hypothetical protein